MFNQNLVPKETPATMMESSIFGGCYCSLPMNTDEEKKKIFPKHCPCVFDRTMFRNPDWCKYCVC